MATQDKNARIKELEKYLHSDEPTRYFYLSHKVQDSSMIKVANTAEGKPTGVIFRYPNNYSLRAEAQIYDEAKGINRIIRYVSGEPSIFKDEQAKESDIPVKVMNVEFQKGFIHVRREEATLMQFLLLHPNNQTNPFRDTTKPPVFFEFKSEHNAEAAIDKISQSMESTEWCLKADFDLVRNHAKVLGVNINQSPKEIRYELLVKHANANPVKFMEGVNNKANQRKYVILTAVEDGIITVNERENSIKWTETGTPICQAPVSVDPITYLVNQTFTDIKGEQLFEHIQILVGKDEQVEAAPKKTSEAYAIQYHADNDLELIKECIAAGVIDDKISWQFYKKDTDKAQQWNGKKAMLKYLKNTPEFRDELSSELAKAKISIS